VWKINLLFYSASFKAHDALFGFPLGEGVELHYPDGRTEIDKFASNDQIALNSLARGLYQVRVWNAPGFSPLTPIALSKDQEVDLMVVSYFDMIFVGALVTAIAGGLVLIGRPEILAWLKPKQPRKQPKPGRPVGYPQVESRRINKDGTF